MGADESMDEATGPDLTNLANRAAIHDLFCRYCDALDNREWALLDEVFLPGTVAYFPTGTDEQGFEEMSIEGRANIVRWLEQIFRDFGPTHHMIGNVTSTLEGDAGSASCRVRAHHVAEAGDERIFEESLARFVGTVRLTTDGWRFEEFRETIAIALGDVEGVSRLAEKRGLDNPA